MLLCISSGWHSVWEWAKSMIGWKSRAKHAKQSKSNKPILIMIVITRASGTSHRSSDHRSRNLFCSHKNPYLNWFELDNFFFGFGGEIFIKYSLGLLLTVCRFGSALSTWDTFCRNWNITCHPRRYQVSDTLERQSTFICHQTFDWSYQRACYHFTQGVKKFPLLKWIVLRSILTWTTTLSVVVGKDSAIFCYSDKLWWAGRLKIHVFGCCSRNHHHLRSRAKEGNTILH